MSTRRDLTITLLRRHPDGNFWIANVTDGGVTVACDRRDGSWFGVVKRPGGEGYDRREVQRAVAQALQSKVFPIEQRERRAREEASRKAKAASRPASPASA